MKIIFKRESEIKLPKFIGGSDKFIECYVLNITNEGYSVTLKDRFNDIDKNNVFLPENNIRPLPSFSINYSLLSTFGFETKWEKIDDGADDGFGEFYLYHEDYPDEKFLITGIDLGQN